MTVNSRCNLACKMCDIGQRNAEGQFYQVMNRNDRMLSPDLIARLVEDIRESKPKFAITGTEPLLYPHLQTIATNILSASLSLQITSNGFLLDRYTDFFTRMEVPELWVSLDGPQKIHDQIRGVDGSFEKAIGALKKMINLKRTLGKSRPGISINFTITELNQHHLVDFLDTLTSLDISPDRLTFCHTNFVTEDMAHLHNKEWGNKYPAAPSCISGFCPDRIETDTLWPQIEETKRRGPFQILFSPDIKTKKTLETYYHNPTAFISSKSCHIAKDSAQILADGTLTVSTRCLNLSLGNLNETPFRELWFGQRRTNFLADLKSEGAFPACSRCCGVF